VISSKERLFWITLIFAVFYFIWDEIVLVRSSYLINGCATEAELKQLNNSNSSEKHKLHLTEQIYECMQGKQSGFEKMFVKIN
jgi:hypothetical protein